MKSNSRVLRGWRDFGVKATAIILTILLATQMVGTPAFASGALTNKQASEDIATTVDDTGVEPSGTEATDTTVPDEAAGAANEPAPADSTQATEEPVVETVEPATEPATETPAADPAANAVLGTEPAPAPAPAPAVEQDQLASIKLDLADGASITLSKDGNKIDDDTNLIEVPANEELKFTVQAADGWQIDAVKTVIDSVKSDPIAADENGEYTIAAEDVTDGLTVKVETSAVPAESQPTDGGEASGNIPPFNGSPIVHATPSSIQVTQKIIGNDDYSGQIQLNLNELPLLLDASCAPAPDLSDGSTYDFAYARVGKTDVASVNYDAGTDQLYLGIDGNSLSGILIDTADSEQIVLWYETHVGEYPVEYVVKCDGEPVDDVSTVGSLVGRNSIRDGETLQFTFAPNEGYEIASVTATNGSVSGESGAYSLNSVTDGTTVTIELTEKTAYNFTFHESSNTDFTGTDAEGATVEFSSSQGGSFTYLRGDSISFTLKANMQNEGNSKALNKVTLSIGSYQNMALNIPTGNNLQVGASETTDLANGMVATVKLTDLGYWEERGPAGFVVLDSGYLPEFEVTVSKGSCDAVRGDITLSTNFKDAETQEVWAKDLVGTELTIAVHNGKSWWEGPGYEYKTLDPSKFEFATIHQDDTYVYVHVLPGFDADDVDLMVYVDGVANGSYELIELNDWTNTPKARDARADGCQYYIVIPESENGKDIRISVVATSEERQYAAAFEDYDGAPGTLDATYSVGDSISVDDGRDVYPTQDGKVFQGWKIKNDPIGTVYLPGDPFIISSDNQGLAEPDAHGLYVYTFVPVWADADQAQSAPYGVNVYFEQDDGTYSETPNASFSESGPYGQTAFLITEKLNEQLASEEGLPDGWQEGYEIDVEKSENLQVEVTGNSSINIYYKKKVNDVSFKMVSGTAGEDVPQAIKDMAPTEPTEAKYKDQVSFEGPAETSYYEDGRGTWKFQGWKIADQAVEDNKFTMPASDVEVVGTWTLETVDLGHPDVTIDYPQDVSYNGADQTWAPTVTDAEGNLLTEGEDYEVSYSTDDRTNVTGVITVTITGKGNYSGTITREYQITPLEIDVYIESQTKVEGEADPTFTFNYEGVLEGESMGWTGAFVRDAGEAAGTYNVAQGGFVLADNEAGNFLASNYTLTVHPGTLTITAAPVPPGPDGPDPVTPVTPLPTPDPTPVPTPTPGDPGATETTTTPATEEATETIEDDATPRTAPEPIDDDATPLAANEHRDCWVHWLMLLGILVTVVYYGGVGVRRVRFSSSLQSFEDDVLGNDETNR